MSGPDTRSSATPLSTRSDEAAPLRESWVSPLLSLPGAVATDATQHPRDEGVAWHYGDPLREQRQLAAGQGIVDFSHRGILAVTGADRLTWLHSLLSQHVEHLSPLVGTQALLLSPHGHVEQHVFLVDDGATTWIHTEPGSQIALKDFLDRMRFMLRVEVRDATAERAVLWRPTPAMPEDQDSLPHAGARGTFLLVHRSELGEWAQTQTPWAGMWAFEALRVAAGEPRLAFETDHRTIPHELGWIGVAVHLQKGCYRGQETVARVHNLGRPPRRLVMLHLDGSTNHLPSTSADVFLGERSVGFVGTAIQHYELGPVALAVVKRTVPLDDVLVVEGVSASQEGIVEP